MIPGGASVGHPVDVASGAVFATYADIHIPGRFPLKWERRYNTGLLETPASPFGPGWTGPCFAALTRNGKDWHFRTPEGTTVILPDPDDRVDKGKVVRNLGTFTEIAKHGIYFKVTRWNVDSLEVARFVFLSGRNGVWWPLRSVEDATGQGLDLAWDDEGRLKGARQKLEKRTLSISTTDSGRVTGVAFLFPDGRTQPLARYEYDSKGMLAAAYDSEGRADRYEYDREGRLVREMARDGGIFTFKYDEKGRCIRTSGLENYDLKIIRYLDHIGWTEVINSYGHVTRYQWLATGQVVLEVGPLGDQTKTEYDEAGRIIGKTDPLGRERKYAFDEEGNRVLVKDDGGETTFVFNASHLPVSHVNAAGSEFKREYDEKNRMLAALDPLGGKWTFFRDRDGNLVKVDMNGIESGWSFGPNGQMTEGCNGEGHRSRFRFDAYGYLEEQVGPMGESYRYRHDPSGRLLESLRPDGARIKHVYDAGGNLAGMQDGTGLSVRYHFGPCKRILSITDTLGRVTRFTWGTEPGHLLAITNPKGEVQKYHRDARGQVVKVRNFSGVEKTFEYDLAGQLAAWTNGMGERIEARRDAQGNLTSLLLPGDETVTFGYDKAGYLVKAANADAEIAFERDALGRTLKETRGDFWIAYAYNLQGRVAHTETSLGLAVGYGYDARNLLREVQVDGDTVVGIARNPLGAEIQRTLPGPLLMEQTVDSVGRMTLQQLIPGAPGAPIPAAGALIRREYRWSGVCVVGIRDDAWGEVDYGYDAAEQLLRATRPGRSGHAYQYDEGGNILSARVGTMQEDCDLGLGNRLLRRGSRSFVYDQAGRQSKRIEGEADPLTGKAREWTFRWDALDQLREVTSPEGHTWSYKYDPMGRRIAKEGPGASQEFYWDRDTVIQDRSGKNPPRSWILDAHTFKPLGQYRQRKFLPIVVDHLGTPREMLDADGKVIWSAVHGPWGEVEDEKGPENRPPIRFQGQWLDEESGLHYNRFRYYDPGLGRFISPDPIGIKGGLNIYRYAPNPINWIDPMGLDWNYVLVNDQDEVYYTGVASDNETHAGVKRRHGKHEGHDGEPRFDPEKDKFYQVTKEGTDHETARGMEQRIAEDMDTVIGRKGSESNPEGSSRGNLQNPVDQSDSNPKAETRAEKAQDLLDKHDTTVEEMIDKAIEDGEPTCGGS